MTNDEQLPLDELHQRARTDPDNVPIGPILNALESGDDADRDRAMSILYLISKSTPERVTDTVPVISSLLESDRPTVRTKAALVMEKVGSVRPDALTPHLDAVLDCLTDRSATVRQSAAGVVRQIAAADPSVVTMAVPQLLPLLDSDIESTTVDAVTVIEAIAEEEPSMAMTAIEPLLTLIGDSDESLPDITYDPNMSVERSLPAEQMRGYQTLVEDAGERSSSVRAREGAVTTIARLADADPENTTERLEPHLPLLFAQLDNPNPTIRAAVVGIVANVAAISPAALEPIEAVLIELLDDSFAVSAGVVWALAHMETDRSDAVLEELIADPETEVPLRRTAETALRDFAE
ncbi:HEAT repeat domain-containing protein [Natronosalvus amylolyticus]|uniref:HEAT repeat domain-containing protein n=1 Tax=Natronosalvus amylolyticus TaxID=2961994 RepID=UPI0020C9F919|nr:HEAT repeat domain-containing protein [Natronosalvus amylolyticus]